MYCGKVNSFWTTETSGQSPHREEKWRGESCRIDSSIDICLTEHQTVVSLTEKAFTEEEEGRGETE